MNKQIALIALVVCVGISVESYADTFSYTDSEGTKVVGVCETA